MKTDYRWELIDHIAVPVLILDQEGQIRAINADGRRFFGIGDSEISAGCSLSEFLSENDQDQFDSHLQQVNAGLEVSDLEINLQILGRSLVPVLITGQLFDPEADQEISTIWTLKPQLDPGPADQLDKLADFQWLAEQGRKLLSMNDWQEILYFSSTMLQERIGDCIILTLTNVDEDNLLLEGVFGIEDNLLFKTMKLVGGDFQGRIFPINDRFRETYLKRSLYLHPGGLEEFAISQVPENISRRLSKLVGLDKIYTIGLETNHKVLGCYYIFTLDRDLKINQELVESFTFQVALALEKSLFSRELELSQQQFQTIFEYAPDGYFVSDSQGNFLNGNREAERITGYAREEFIGKNFLKSKLLTADQLPRAAKLLAKGFSRKATEPSEFLLNRKDGSKIAIEVSTHPVKLGGQSVVLGIARDISHRRTAEDNLNLANQTITRVLEGIDAHVYAADFNSYEILYMNKRMIEDYGGDFTGKLCFEVFRGVKEICQDCSNKHLVNLQGEPGEVYVWEGQNIRTKKWYRNYDRVIYWTGKQLAKLQISVDISDSKMATTALIQSEERYRILFDKSHNAIMTVAPPDWNFTSGNSAMVKMFRLQDEKHFLEMKPWMLSPEFQPDGRSSLEKAQEMIERAVKSGSNFFNWTHRRLNGEDFPATVQLTRVEHGADYFLQATVRDITERVLAEKLVQEQMDDLAVINALNVTANQGLSVQEIQDKLAEKTRHVFGSKNTTVYLLSKDKRYLQVHIHSLESTFREQLEKLIKVEIPTVLQIELNKDSHFQKIISSNQPQILSDPNTIQELMKDFVSATFLRQTLKRTIGKMIPQIYKLSGIESMIVAPLIASGELIGLVDMSLPYLFPAEDLERFVTIAGQISGIIQKLLVEQDRAVKLQELEFINQAIGDVARLNDIDEICDHLADSIRRINPEAYIVVSLYDPALESIRVRSVKGLGKLGDRVIDLLGGKPEQIQINTREYALDSKLNALYTSGKMEFVPDGLYSLTRGKFSRKICKSIEKLGGVDRTYITGFGLGEVSTGGLVLMLKEGVEIQHPEAIEAVVRHYAVVFERRIAQEEVLKRKVQLEALKVVEHEIVSELDIDSLLQSIAEKATRIVNASACGFSIYNSERNVLEYTAYTGFDELPEVTDVYPGEGLSGRVWERKETITVQNYALWEGRLENWAPLSHYYLAGIPVSWGDEMLGVLEVALDPSESLSKAELDTLELFATQAAIALKNARLFRDEKDRRTEAETLREVGVIINQMVDQPDLLEMILVSLQKVVPYHSASIQLVKGPDVVVEAFSGGNPREDVIGTSYNINDNEVSKRILYEGHKIILNSRADIEDQLENQGSQDIASWLAVPMESKGNRIGILTLDHINPGQYSEQDAALVADFSSQAVVALENNRLFEAIRRRTREIEVVYDSALTLTKELQPDVLFEHLHELIQPIFNPDAYILATYEPAADMIRIAYATEAGARQLHAEGLLFSPEEKNSLLSWIVRKKAPLCIGNVETDSLPVQPQQQGKTIHSWLGVPLLIGDRVCGALVVQSYQPNKYTHDDQRLLQLLGNQVAVALENSRLFDDSQRRLSRLASLHEIDQAISGSVDLRTTLDVLVGHLIHTLGVDAACVLSYNHTSQTLEYVNAKGFRTTSLQYTSLKIGTGLAGKAALERSLVYLLDLTTQDTSLQQSPQFAKEEFVTYLAQPLVAKGELVGVLEVFHRQKLTPDPEWFRFLDSLSGSAAIAIDRLNLFNDLERSHTELKQAYDATIEGWSRAIELRDGETSGHSRRVVALTMNLGRKMGLGEDELTHMRRGSLLHDIGKMAVPDGILLKAGKLSDEEWLVMKKHPGFAYEMLSKISYLEQALDIPYAHHERWDGSGYPRGLAGEDIPLQARIFAVVDVWDALQSDRPYREAWPKEKAIQYLKDESGKEFDPAVVKEFLDLLGLD